MSAFNIGKLVGVLVGMGVGVILIAFLLKWTKKDHSIRAKYDERQSMIRGRGYCIAFYTVVILNIIYAIFGVENSPLPIASDAALIFIAFIGVIVHVAYCIWNGAYFSLNESRNRVLITFALLGIINFALGIFSITSGSALTDGKINIGSINFVCGILFLVIFAILLLRKIFPSREDFEEEE